MSPGETLAEDERMTTHQTLEHTEHAEHAAEHGNKRAALVVAALAAVLAICEQQAKHAEIKVEENSIAAADAWNQYQAKSVRQAIARDLERLAATFDAPTQVELISRRADLLKQYAADQQHYEKDAKDGKEAIATRARSFEATREEELERTHTFDNAAAALQLGIVLATASVITSSAMLIWAAYGVGALGVILGILGWVVPGLAAF
jgi:hypothetical protein